MKKVSFKDLQDENTKGKIMFSVLANKTLAKWFPIAPTKLRNIHFMTD